MLKSQKIKGQARRGQLITGSGVGCVVALGEESWMIAGLDEWPVVGAEPDLGERRLAHKLGVRGFRLPAATGKDRGLDVPVVRFPRMVSCPGCADPKTKRAPLDWHFKFTSGAKNNCIECGGVLVPSRFVMVCERGHIDEFPFFQWLHKGMDFSREDTGKHKMTIMARGGSSLSDLVLGCSCGVTPRTLEGALDKDALKGYKKCSGARPWLGDSEECDCQPRGLQRGASNVYFSITESSLSIPPWSEGVDKVMEKWWLALKNCPSDALEPMIEGMRITEGTVFSPRDIKKAVLARKGEDAAPTDLKIEEYDALCAGKKETSRDQDFVCVPAEGVAGVVGEWFEQVMLVTRLREVVALTGFSRLQPVAGTPEDVARVAPLWKRRGDWLPATEVRGEGVFLRLNEERLREWEKQEVVCERAARLNAAFVRRHASFGTVAPFDVSARLILIHTLAHVLIRTWALDCGYASSSLRERLYVSAPTKENPDEKTMSGLLIYTASSDSAGSLGGLTLMGRFERLEASLRQGVRDASWCSSDPLCLESEAGGTDGLNGAACHACVLLPESSCEHYNTLLDRAFLVGMMNDPTPGFFSELMA